MISLPHLPPAPEGTMRCLLCEGIMGGEERYDRHLQTEHMVAFNRSWLVEQTVTETVTGHEDQTEVQADDDIMVITEEIIEDGPSFVVDADPLELMSMREHEDNTPNDKLRLEKLLMENPSHQNVKKWVISALRRCRVTLRECHYKMGRDRNHNLSDNVSGQALGSGLPSREDKSVELMMGGELERVTASKSSVDVGNGKSEFNSEDMSCEWMDGNIFSCRKCVFTIKSLAMFSNHVETHHKKTLAKFSGGYTKTSVKYQCRICRKMVYHERSVVKEHVESHLLELTEYALLYEKENMNNTSALKVSDVLDSPEKSEILTSVDLFSIPPSLPIVSPSSSLPATSSISSAAVPPSLPTTTRASDFADKFVYVCPFLGCAFSTDLQGMKTGPAAEHGIEQHQVSPWEVKQQGLKWKRVSREKMMRKERSGIKM